MNHITIGRALSANPKIRSEDETAATEDARKTTPIKPNEAHAVIPDHSPFGWSQIGDRWLYLHAAGAIGPKSSSDRMGSLIARIALPPVASNPLPALQWCFFMEQVAAPRTSLPLLAAMFRAPTLEFLPVEGSLALVGPFDARKRSLALVASSAWGLGECDDTFRTIHAAMALYSAKDMLVVVEGKFRYTTAGGNDAKQQPYVARAESTDPLHLPCPGLTLFIADDEADLFAALDAGTFVIAIGPNDVDDKALKQIQSARNALAEAMSSYIAWLAPRAETLQDYLLDRYAAWFGHFDPRVRSPEAASTAAHLMLGAELLGHFSQEVGALDDRSRQAFVHRVGVALLGCMDHWRSVAKHGEVPVTQ